MTKRKITVTHNGQTFTRVTARNYSHIVLFQRDIEAARRALVPTSGWLEQWARDHAFFREEAARGRQQYTSEATFVEYQRKAAQTVEEYAQERGAEWIRNFENSVAHGHYSKQYVHSWCGRLDLAQKQYNDALKSGYINVEIVAL